MSVTDIGFVVFLSIFPGCLVVVGFFDPYTGDLRLDAVGPGWIVKHDVSLEVLSAFAPSFSLEGVALN